MAVLRLAFMLILSVGAALGDGVDLAREYPATLDDSPEPIGRAWQAEIGDVWRLSSFALRVSDDLNVETGPATLVIGHHQRNALWAVLLPDKDGRLKSSVTPETERVTSVWLRFHPARVGELFPAKTVVGNGSPDALLWARRICAWKMNGSWQAGNQPVVPQRNSVVVDAEIAGGARRFFINDTDAGTVKYEPYFAQRGLPKLVEINPADAAAAFEKVWRAFDEEYAMFAIKPGVSWGKLRDDFKPRLRDVQTTYEAAAVIAQMLTKLEDLHVWVRVGNEFVPTYDRPRPLNASFQSAQKVLGALHNESRQLAWARTDDGIGYAAVLSLGDSSLADEFDRALEKLADTWAMVIDLRYNGGGDEILAQRLAGRLADKRRVYSYSQYRNGSKHTDLTDRLPREVEPRGPWRYQSPVLVLSGPRTMSSAESFVCMLDVCPQIRTLGAPTAGASANPRQIDAGAGITVNLPRWLDLGPDGKPFENIGLKPDISVAATPEQFRDDDPVLRRALEELRQQPEVDRRPGKRE